MPIIPENVIGMPTSPPKSGNPKPKLANPTTINKMGIILLIIFVYSPVIANQHNTVGKLCKRLAKFNKPLLAISVKDCYLQNGCTP